MQPIGNGLNFSCMEDSRIEGLTERKNLGFPWRVKKNLKWGTILNLGRILALYRIRNRVITKKEKEKNTSFKIFILKIGSGYY